MTSHGNHTSKELVPAPQSIRRWMRITAIMLAIGVPGAIAAGLESGSATASPQRADASASAHVAHEARAGSKQTTLPQCGATRDPFDPTNSPPPAGSATAC